MKFVRDIRKDGARVIPGILADRLELGGNLILVVPVDAAPGSSNRKFAEQRIGRIVPHVERREVRRLPQVHVQRTGMPESQRLDLKAAVQQYLSAAANRGSALCMGGNGHDA